MTLLCKALSFHRMLNSCNPRIPKVSLSSLLFLLVTTYSTASPLFSHALPSFCASARKSLSLSLSLSAPRPIMFSHRRKTSTTPNTQQSTDIQSHEKCQSYRRCLFHRATSQQLTDKLSSFATTPSFSQQSTTSPHPSEAPRT